MSEKGWLRREGKRLRPYVKEHKAVFIVYLVLRFIVIAAMALSIADQNWEHTFVCILVLVLFLVPDFLQRKLDIRLPSLLQIIILLFIFAAEILGELSNYYVQYKHWDTVLHTVNGFLFAAIGFSIVNLLNEDKHVAMSLSPFYMAVAAFCFSMTIGVLWEFFEWGMDSLFSTDMQKDTVLQSISTIAIHPEGKNIPITVKGITDVILVLEDGTQKSLHLGGYLDIGLQDTMKDLLVNLIGAVVFSCIGYFYIKTKGKGKVAKHFIPTVVEKSE